MDKILELKKVFASTVYCAFMCMILTGCMTDELPLVEPQHGDKMEFQLNIPTATQVVTRATTAASAAELDIKQGYCLIYASNGAAETPVMSHTFDISSDIATGGNGTTSPTITIPKKVTIEANHVVVFILNTPFEGSGALGDRLDDIQYSEISTKFPLDGKSGFETTAGEGIPMYGELTGFSGTGTATMTIFRSVAKVQVKLKSPMTGSATNVGDFTTANIKYQIFNQAITGNVNYGAGFNTETTQALNPNDLNKAPESTIQGQAIAKETVTDISNDNYTGASYIYEYHYSNNTIGASGSTDTPETDAANANRLAIILYNAANSKYYRLDLAHSGPEYIDAIRNHHYQIMITEVNSDGYATADEALTGTPSNIIYEIIDNTGNTTISNGKYAISVGEEFYANGEISELGIPATVASNVRYITTNGSPLPSGVTSAITCIDAATKNPIASNIITVSPAILTNIGTSLAFTFIDQSYTGDIAFKITLGSLSYESAPITIASNAISGVHINIGEPGHPKWLIVADRNADINGPNGGAVGNSATDYGHYYFWSNADNNPTDTDKSYSACFNFGEGNGTWRQPTGAEMLILSGPTTANNNLRKLQFADGTWKVYDDRPGEAGNFAYFPMGGYFYNNEYGHVDEYGYYWSSTGGNSAQILAFSAANGVSHRSNYNIGSNTVAFPVRCVQDVPDPNVTTADEVGVNLGTAENPEWIEVADRNADRTTANGAAVGNSLTDYGSHYQWSSVSVDPTNTNKAYNACFTFREGNGTWRLPTENELLVLSHINTTDDTLRKLQSENAEWKLYDERPGQEGKFAYFPYAGYINGSSFGTTNIISSQDIAGYYWSSDIAPNQTDARQLNLTLENQSHIQSYPITYGMAVRCVRSIPAP